MAIDTLIAYIGVYEDTDAALEDSRPSKTSHTTRPA